jgi:phage shock protein C
MTSKRLYRSRLDKMIGGVAGGLAIYFDIDPTIVRVLFVITIFIGGGGILAYIILLDCSSRGSCFIHSR